MKLKDKVAIITGGTSGIGLAVAKDFLCEGAKVIVSSYSVEEFSKNKNQLKGATFIKCDVRREREVKNLIKRVVDKYGRLDIMVANAGIGDGDPIGDEKTETWNNILSINLTGVFLCNKYAIKEMLKNKSGSIINMSSVLGLVGNPVAPAYSSCKAGVINLTRSGALAYSKEGIRVNAVSPGYIKTPLIESIPDEALIPLHPIGRLGKDYEVAKAVTFLASDDASFITGVVLPVDGGYTAQ